MTTTQFQGGPILRRFVSCALVIGTAVACGDDARAPLDSRATRAESASAGSPMQARAALSSAPASEAVANAAPPVAAADQLNSSPTNAITSAMIIRNGAVSIEIDSLELAIAAVRQVATALGGYVGNTSQESGAFSVRSATIELKIPSASYDRALNNLHPIGKIESESSSAEDVGEEFFDVTARQANARRLEERLITLLATRTGKLEDVLAVERELARVREEIERYEGRLRYLRSHVATSTLVVTVHEKRAVVSEYTGRNVIVESFRNAWRIFVSFVAIAISSLGWIIPLAVMVGVGVLVWKRVRAKA